MTKKDIIKEVARITDFRQADVTTVVDTFIEAVKKAALAGETIKLNGFGTISTKEYGERNGVNPQTGEKIVIPARKCVKMKLSTTWK